METTTVRRRHTVTAITKAWNLAKKLENSEKLELMAMLIDSVKPAVAESSKPRLYDPETGEYLNDKTMQVIENVRNGKEPTYEMKSLDEFKAWCEAL